MFARYKNVATPKQRDMRARLRLFGCLASPLPRPNDVKFKISAAENSGYAIGFSVSRSSSPALQDILKKFVRELGVPRGGWRVDGRELKVEEGHLSNRWITWSSRSYRNVDIDAVGLTRVVSDRHHRWHGILDFASRTSHRAVVG